jgi:hypothetical protein
VSVRAQESRAPHLGLGLAIVRIVARAIAAACAPRIATTGAACASW